MTAEDIVIALVIGVVGGFITGWVAQRKGHSFARWWLLGALLWFVFLPWALLLKQNPETRRRCPLCRTWVDAEARVCPQCGRDIFEHLASAGQ